MAWRATIRATFEPSPAHAVVNTLQATNAGIEQRRVMHVVEHRLSGEASGKGVKVGTEGQSLRLENFALDLPKDTEGGIEYRGHIQNKGWDEWVAGGKTCGTAHQSLRLEAVRLSMPGLPVGGGIRYEVHAQDKGWMPAVADGALAGTTGQSRRLEAVRISLTGDAAKEGNYSVWYRVHSQDYGWLGWAHDGAEAGTLL